MLDTGQRRGVGKLSEPECYGLERLLGKGSVWGKRYLMREGSEKRWDKGRLGQYILLWLGDGRMMLLNRGCFVTGV